MIGKGLKMFGVAAAGVGIAIAVGCYGSVRSAVPRTGLRAEAMKAAIAAGDPTPTSIEYVRSTRKVANALVSGDIVGSDQAVDMIVITGRFTVDHPLPGHNPRHCAHLVLIVDARTGDGLDSGCTFSKMPDISKLGAVKSLS